MENLENKELAAILRERIRDRGPIPFAEFMEIALYHPEQGYYHSAREKIGPKGDYYTSPDLHPVFGRLLARQLYQMWTLLGRPSPFAIVELGAGKGRLCADILEFCQGRLPDFYEALLYSLADRSSAWQESQHQILAEHAAKGKVNFPSIDFLADNGEPVTGCFLSNELIDAFPVHLVQQQGEALYEIYITARGDSWRELPGPPSTPSLKDYLRDYGRPLADGQRGEINLRALEWIEKVGRKLQRGFVLTIDYGYPAEELYHPDRREGTLLCYFRHTTSPDPLRHIGFQDITSHVNFTALIRRGEALSLERIGFTEQYKFLTALGLLAELEDLEKSTDQSRGAAFFKNKLAMRNFLVPGGMGSLFKVLAQGKGTGPVELHGFKDPLRNAG